MSRARILADYVSSGDELAAVVTDVAVNTAKVTNSTDASDLATGTVAVARGGTGASTAAAAATALGLGTGNTPQFTGLNLGGVALASTMAELNFSTDVTSLIQAQLNGKQATGSYLTTSTTSIAGLSFEAGSGTVSGGSTKEIRAYTSWSGGWGQFALIFGVGYECGGISGIGGGMCAASGYLAGTGWYNITAIQPTSVGGSYGTLVGPTKVGGYVKYVIGSNTTGKTNTFRWFILGHPGAYIDIV
jgi:hypothetical protein